MSPKFTLNKEDLKKIGAAIGWSMLSAALASIAVILADVSIPTEYLFLVPFINTLIYSMKKYVDGKIE